MSFQKIGDCVHYYSVAGESNKPVLVFANSLGSDLRIWDRMTALLVKDFRIVRYDVRGHGLSEALAPPYTVKELAGDLAGLLNALEIQTALICGLSLGGVIAQQFAIDYPARVRALVLCDTGARIGSVASWQERIEVVKSKGLAALAAPSMERWFTESYRRTHPDDVRGYANMVLRTAPDGYIGACSALRDADLIGPSASIRQPTLVLCGEQDIATPPEMARQLANIIPGARLSMIPDAAHISCVEQPGIMVARTTQFLKEVQGG